MSNATGHPLCEESPISVAVAGTDDWLSRRIGRRLAGSGLAVRDVGTGSSSLHQVNTLVLVPRLVPQSANPARDVGMAQCGITLAAAALGKVEHVVLVSLVGADPVRPGHLGALGRLEALVLASGSRVTLIRATQVYGAANDPGPFIELIHHALCLQPARLAPIEIEPVFVGDVVKALEAAVDGRLPPEIFEMAGHRRIKVTEFVQRFERHAHLKETTSVTRRFFKLPSKRRGARALGDLLESQPLAIRRHPRPSVATDGEEQTLATPNPAHVPTEAA
jgi:hypothetical protein